MTHRPFSIHCQDMVNVYEMNERSRELHFLSFAFDGAHERLHTALICGASVVLRDHTLWTAAETLQTMASKRVTNAGFPPAYLKELADSAETSGTHPASVRLYSFGGEAMSKESFHKVRCHLQPEILINGYGPTEAVVTPVLWKTHNKVNVQSPYAPIGKPVAARKAVVLDDALNLLPTGIVGELYLGGEGLARGYLNRGAMTSEKFIADPFDAAGGRLYRTGDLVRWNKDGELEYLGRIDHQVKIRGFRIEIGEVEAQLRALPEIKEAVVLAQEGPHGSRLLGYAVPYFPQTIDGAEIRKRLGDFLPEYMVPSVITLLDKVPVNTNGKIDRNALPAPDPISETLYEAPRGELETIIARIWQDVLGIDRIGRDDHFFELGGHSLLALKAIQRAQIQTIHSEVSIAMLMKNPQLKTFAAALLNDTNAKVEVITLSLNKKGNPLFCFPGLVVNSSEYNRLMSAVGQDRPVHAFVSHAVGPRRWELTSLNELAETYAQYIEDNCPGGVCSLLGWSFGGDIAFATAGKLAGRVKVDFLGLADVTRPVQTVRSLAEPGRVEAEKIMQVWLSRSPMESHWQKLIAQIPAELMDAVLYQVLSAEDLPLDGPEIGSVEYLQWATLDSQRMRTGFAYPYINVPIYAWEAEDSNPSGIPGRYWERYGNLRSSVIIEGTDHFSIVRDEVFVSSVRKVLNEIFSQTIQSGSNTNLADVSALME
ncbi:MAG: AMP-binding protein [Cellvibrionaceae bacterium]|nr:AMP-binding protein [Cellvibrionaceae bacterium]